MLARMRQMDRFREEKLTKNAQMGQNEIEKYCRLGKEEERMMRQAYEVMKLFLTDFTEEELKTCIAGGTDDRRYGGKRGDRSCDTPRGTGLSGYG